MADYSHYPQGPKLCTCGHSKFVHRDCFHGSCVGKQDQPCKCERYTPKGQLEVIEKR